MTFESRFYEATRTALAATVESMATVELSPEAYLEGLRRHRGNVVVGGES